MSAQKAVVDKMRTKFTPQNPNKLTDDELRQFLELSDEDEVLSPVNDGEISDENKRFLSQKPSFPPPSPRALLSPSSQSTSPIPVPQLSPPYQKPIPSTSTADPIREDDSDEEQKANYNLFF